MKPSCENFPLLSLSCVRKKSFHTVKQWIRNQTAAEMKICFCLYDVTHSSFWIKQVIWHRRRHDWFFLDFPVIFHYRECLIKSRFLSIIEKLKRQNKTKTEQIKQKQNKTPPKNRWNTNKMEKIKIRSFEELGLVPDEWRLSLLKTSPSQKELLLTLLNLRITRACLKFHVSLLSKVGSTRKDGLLLQEFWCFSITPGEVNTYSWEPPP